MTKVNKVKAVKRVFLLHKNGVNITEARQTVAEELGLNAGRTIWNWQRQLKMTPPTTSIVKNNNTVIPRERVINTRTNARNWRSDLGKVFSSLINKDGVYSTKEAGAISQVANAALGQARYDLEIHKLAEMTTSKRNKSLDHLLV